MLRKAAFRKWVSADRPSVHRPSLERLEDRTLLTAASFMPGEVLVQFRADATPAQISAVHGMMPVRVAEQVHTRLMAESGQGVLERLELPAGMSVHAAMKVLGSNPGVEYVEPNWIYTPTVISNDPYYTTSSRLWGMYSDDSPTAIGPSGTTNIYGSQAEEAWNAGYTGSDSVFVGIIDEGFQYNHPDLAANAWTNPYDPVDGIDNDGNGYIDDVHGWDFYYDDNTTYDGTADDHGTHVAGTIGAEGGNSTGVAGVNWSVTMISTKFLGPNGGSTLGAVRALDYLTDLKVRHGLNIVASNNSWGGGGYSQALLDAINRAANQGILFIAAAGNSSSNNDSTASYPSNYSTVSGAGYEAVIAVAAIASNGGRASFSSYGATTVDLGAPGVGINSTVPTNSYASYSGTSMATPHVTGAAALYASVHPGATAEQIRDALLQSTTPTTSLSGVTVTGGRLNIAAALGIVPGLGVSVGDASVTEGDSGTTQATFTVTLTQTPTETVTVTYSTADGSATAGSDYVADSGTLTFLAGGSTSQTVSVTVNGDTDVEGNETFFLNLTNAAGASINDGQGTGTIVNDDVPPVSLSINDVSINEGKSGTRNLKFTVTLSQSSSVAVSVAYATADDTATAGSDYAAKSGTLTFSPGSTSKTFNITIYGDRTVEPDETFFVNLSSPVNASIGDGQGVGTIKNDDRGRLLASGTPSNPVTTTADLSPLAIAALVAEARDRWAASGLVSQEQVDGLDVQVRVVDLPGQLLGMARGSVLWIDRDAAGFGWFVDRSPGTDGEFGPHGVGTNSGRMDLLSALAHEMGHLLGFDHDEPLAVMADTLAAGVRHLPEPGTRETVVRPTGVVVPVVTPEDALRDAVFGLPGDDGWLSRPTFHGGQPFRG